MKFERNECKKALLNSAYIHSKCKRTSWYRSDYCWKSASALLEQLC